MQSLSAQGIIMQSGDHASQVDDDQEALGVFEDIVASVTRGLIYRF